MKQNQQHTRAVLYTRPAQYPTGSSVERQLTECREFAEAHGYTMIGEFKDVGLAPSMTTLPMTITRGYRRMVETAAAGAASIVVVTNYARISRCLAGFSMLRDALADRGIAIETPSEAAASKGNEADELRRQVLAAASRSDNNEGVRHCTAGRSHVGASAECTQSAQRRRRHRRGRS